MTIEILEDLLKHCKKNTISLPVIVFADGFKGHYGIEIAEFCDQNKIKMIFLKPNTTHACQPLDVTCFSPLKSMIRKLSHEWHGRPENSNKKLDKYTIMKEVTWQAIEKVFSNPTLVSSGFRRSGLLPFGPENMDWEKFSSSKMYDRNEKDTADESVVEGCLPICNNNNNNTLLMPEFCGNADDVADPAFRPHPFSPAEESDQSEQVVTGDPLLSQLGPVPSVYEAPTVPNTPLLTPESSVSRPPADTDRDPLMESLPALTLTAQASSAPPPLSLTATTAQTLSAPPPSVTDDSLSLEDRIAASLVNKQKNLNHDKKVRQLQRYEHLIDPDGEKITEFETLYKAARFDIRNTEYQNWLLYKQQASGTESEAFDRILEKKIPKNVQLRKKKRKDYLPPGKDRFDLTSFPMMQAMRDMAERAETGRIKKSRVSKPSTVTSMMKPSSESSQPAVPPVDFSKLDMSNPEDVMKATKKGKTIMLFAKINKFVSREETEEVSSLWLSGMYNAHIQSERFLIEDNRVMFSFKDESYAWKAKDFLIEQERIEDVQLGQQTYRGTYAAAEEREKTDKKEEEDVNETQSSSKAVAKEKKVMRFTSKQLVKQTKEGENLESDTAKTKKVGEKRKVNNKFAKDDVSLPKRRMTRKSVLRQID